MCLFHRAAEQNNEYGVDTGPQAPIDTASHSSTSQMAVSHTRRAICWCLCRVETLCSKQVNMLSTSGILVCLWALLCAHDEHAKSKHKQDIIVYVRSYKTKASYREHGKTPYPLPPKTNL